MYIGEAIKTNLMDYAEVDNIDATDSSLAWNLVLTKTADLIEFHIRNHAGSVSSGLQGRLVTDEHIGRKW